MTEIIAHFHSFSRCFALTIVSLLLQCERLEAFLGGLLEDEVVVDAVVSQSSEHESEIWAIREQLPLCLMALSRAPVVPIGGLKELHLEGSTGGPLDSDIATRCSKLYKYDVSIPLRDTSAVVSMVRKQMGKEMVVAGSRIPRGTRLEYCCFGHAGDQNLHLNVLLHYPTQIAHTEVDSQYLEELEEVKKALQISLDRAVFKAVLSVKGSVSAEHGVGQQKRSIMSAARSPAELLLMAALKRTVDPNGILNPGKVLPDGY